MLVELKLKRYERSKTCYPISIESEIFDRYHFNLLISK